MFLPLPAVRRLRLRPTSQGRPAASVGSAAAEGRSILSIQLHRADPADGHVHHPCSLAGLHLVLHRKVRTLRQAGDVGRRSSQLESRSVYHQQCSNCTK